MYLPDFSVISGNSATTKYAKMSPTHCSQFVYSTKILSWAGAVSLISHMTEKKKKKNGGRAHVLMIVVSFPDHRLLQTSGNETDQ